MRGLFITGTDTGVGKTWVACTIVRALRTGGFRTGAYKPVCSGAEVDAAGTTVWQDLEALQRSLGGEIPLERIGPQRFRAPLAPPLAAEQEGAVVNPQLLRDGISWWHNRADVLIVEGAGGLLSPLTWTDTNLDLARDLGFPVVIVAANRLGTVNQTLLTLACLQSAGLETAALVLNDVAATGDASRESNVRLLTQFAPQLRLGTIPFRGEHVKTRDYGWSGVDWWELAREGGAHCEGTVPRARTPNAGPPPASSPD